MRVAIIYHYIAHYRLPIFRELKKSKKINFQLVAGIHTDIPIKVVNNKKFNFNVLKNYWFFNKKLLWQSNLLSLLFKKVDHYIFLGNPYFISTWMALFLCKIFRKKASIWTHGVTTDLTKSKRKVLQILWFLSSRIFVYGHYARNKMIDYGVDPKKIVVVYNSLDYVLQLNVRENFEKNNQIINYFKNDNPLIIFTGRLTKVKKLDQILEAIKILKDKGVYCNLVMIGEGSERAKLESLVLSLSLENNVWFYGSCYDETQIGSFFMSSKVCVAPGNVGLTAMHSLVYGIPVVTHSNFDDQMPEFEAIVDGVTGSFFRKDDIIDLARKINYWLSKSDNETKQQQELCYKIIDDKYNPKNQREIFEKSLRNEIIS